MFEYPEASGATRCGPGTGPPATGPGPSVCPWPGPRAPDDRLLEARYVVAMRVTHLGHACLLVEIADSRILIDPGSFSTGFDSLRDLDAVVVTHQHADHLDEDRLPALLAFNRQAPVYADPESAELLDGNSSDIVVLAEGEKHRVGTTTIRPVGRLHAANHDRVPRCTNVGVVLQADGEPSLYHPGDAYDGEPGETDVLAVPLNAPWSKVAETIVVKRMPILLKTAVDRPVVPGR